MASGAPPLKTLYSKFPVKTDSKVAKQIIEWRLRYETRDTHPEALNTPLLGVSNIGWFPRDSQALFDILEINKDEFKLAIKQSSIDNNFRVASDEFNQLTVWAAHNFFNSTSLSRDTKDKVITALFFMMIVKFFSSVCRHTFPYRATRAIMEATIDNLSDKFDIKHRETSTWKLVMDHRAELMADQSSANIHLNALKTFVPDKKVIYIITNLQTSIRTKIRLVAQAYYEAVKRGNAIMEGTLTGEDPEGEKTIKELQNSYDSMIESICNRALNAQQFIRNDYVKVVCALCSNVRPEMMRNVLMQFSAKATAQYRKSNGDSLDKSGKFFDGYHILISNMIQRTYRACIVDKVPLKRGHILKKAMNLYRSSRINDPIVIQVKDSVDAFIESTKVSSRDATNASIKIAFILYIILLSFNLD